MASSDPIAIITGGSRGIGLQIARTLGENNHRVVLVARDAQRLQEAKAELEALGTACSTVAVDLLAEDSPQRILDATKSAFGEPDVLINNAGTAPTAKVESTTDEMLTETLDMHVRVPLRLIRAILPGMKTRNTGCIVQLASPAGLRGFAFTSAYTAAKHGMLGLTRAVHAELSASGVDVYAICPGFVDTDITRQAAASIAARGRLNADEALAAMAAQNRLGRMHSSAEVAESVLGIVRDRPSGCVLELDRDPPTFLD